MGWNPVSCDERTRAWGGSVARRLSAEVLLGQLLPGEARQLSAAVLLGQLLPGEARQG